MWEDMESLNVVAHLRGIYFHTHCCCKRNNRDSFCCTHTNDFCLTYSCINNMCFPWNRYYLIYTNVKGDFFFGHVHTLDCCLITTQEALIATELVTLVGNINTVSYNFNAPILVTSASHIITTTLLLTVKLLFAIQSIVWSDPQCMFAATPPPAISEYHAHNIGLRLLENRSFNSN